MTSGDSSESGSTPQRRIIKRYSNRKLYDTKGSTYVTLLQIAEMIRDGEDVQIIDNATKEDKTDVTLALIISEELRAKPRAIPLTTLKALIRHRGERILTQLREGPIGKLMPRDTRGRFDVIQWVMFQMGNIGPMLGQAHHFRHYAPEPIPYAVARYTNEAGRLYGVIDRRLKERDYLAGEYSIADIATFPWLRSWERQGQNIEDYPNLKRWFDAIAARPAVQRGLQVLADRSRTGPMDAKAKEVLFGATQYQRR